MSGCVGRDFYSEILAVAKKMTIVLCKKRTAWDTARQTLCCIA